MFLSLLLAYGLPLDASKTSGEIGIKPPNISVVERLEAPSIAHAESLAMIEVPSETKPSSVAESTCNTGNVYKDFIYMHESGCNPGSVNSIGCRGLGQACPGTKLPCGNDFACQDAYFTQYALGRYGSWEAAYQFWKANNWW